MHHPATPTPRKATTADPVAGAVAMVAAAEATAAVVVGGAVAVAEEVDGNSLLVWRSRCVMMIPKRSNLLQQRPSAAILISALLVQHRPSTKPFGAWTEPPSSNQTMYAYTMTCLTRL